jgi:hypothetical protein
VAPSLHIIITLYKRVSVFGKQLTNFFLHLGSYMRSIVLDSYASKLILFEWKRTEDFVFLSLYIQRQVVYDRRCTKTVEHVTQGVSSLANDRSTFRKRSSRIV